jgi:hypothetical protein
MMGESRMKLESFGSSKPWFALGSTSTWNTHRLRNTIMTDLVMMMYRNVCMYQYGMTWVDGMCQSVGEWLLRVLFFRSKIENRSCDAHRNRRNLHVVHFICDLFCEVCKDLQSRECPNLIIFQSHWAHSPRTELRLIVKFVRGLISKGLTYCVPVMSVRLRSFSNLPQESQKNVDFWSVSVFSCFTHKINFRLP